MSTNSDGISLANHGMFAELPPAKVYCYTVIYYTKYYIQCHQWFMPTWIFIVVSFWQSACVWLEQINLQALLYIYIYYFLLNEPCYYNDFLLLTNYSMLSSRVAVNHVFICFFLDWYKLAIICSSCVCVLHCKLAN